MQSPYTTRTATVFLVFNRPDVTALVFEKIREARPPRLLVVCDGPRADRPDEATKVEAVRDIIDRGIDWPCEVIRNYADTNMGCRERVASGLNWAFTIVDEAIILEDDCVPENSFFWYCDEMLEFYRNDHQVMHISGYNANTPYLTPKASYWFSRHPWIWGWATWRRAWQKYDFEMKTWKVGAHLFEASFSSNWEKAFWCPQYHTYRNDPHKQNTWDFSWVYTCRSLGALCVFPKTNLINNVGFGVASTHTSSALNRLPMKTQALDRLIIHPSIKKIDRYADELFTRIYAGAPVNGFANTVARLRIWRDYR